MNIKAISYLRTSSATGVGEDKDSDKRQRASIESFAKAAGYEIVAEFYDAGVSGADPVSERPGFAEMMERIAGNGVRTIIVESPDRFARDLLVQLTGFDYLKAQGIALIPASAPDFFTQDTPTATLIRSVLGAVAQFEKASIVARMRVARERKRAAGERCEGNKPLALTRPDVVARAKRLKADGYSYREIQRQLAATGFRNGKGKPYALAQIGRMLAP